MTSPSWPQRASQTERDSVSNSCAMTPPPQGKGWDSQDGRAFPTLMLWLPSCPPSANPASSPFMSSVNVMYQVSIFNWISVARRNDKTITMPVYNCQDRITDYILTETLSLSKDMGKGMKYKVKLCTLTSSSKHSTTLLDGHVTCTVLASKSPTVFIPMFS